MLWAKGIKVLEIACWCLGIALVGLYFALRAEGEVGRRAAISQFQEATASSNAISKTGVFRVRNMVHASLNVPTPDKTHWSPGRIRAYETAQAKAATRTGFPVAVLRIPKVGLAVPVYVEDTARNMNRGAVVVSGTALPGAAGNTAIAAHRDGYFRVLKDVAVGDLVILQTFSGARKYRIASLKVVKPTDISVLSQTSTPVVTLVTCYPFYFVGTAPRRFIVQAIALKKSSPEERTSPADTPASAIRKKINRQGKTRPESSGVLKTRSWHHPIRLNVYREKFRLIKNATGVSGAIRRTTFGKGGHEHQSGNRLFNIGRAS